MKIKDIPSQNRPIERLNSHGVNALSDSELLGIIIGTGTRENNAIDLGNKVIQKFGLDKISRVNLTELKKIQGIGNSKATRILASIEFSKRIKSFKAKKNIKKASDVYNYLKHRISNLEKETFIVLMLDTKNNILLEEIVSIGTVDSTIVHPRDIFKLAIKENSSAIILVHNHPSGNPAPSQEDLNITKKIISAGETLGIKVLDHVIIGRETYWSYNEKT